MSRSPVAGPTLDYALLALLAKQPNTAYEIALRARRPLGYFWTASYSQIHPRLRALTSAGLLTVASTAGPGPHDKRVYTITAAGRAALADWVAQPPRPDPGRDELLLKVYALWTVEPERARTLMRAQAATHRRRLAEYEEIHERLVRAAPGPAEPDFGSLATVRYGVGYERHRAEWCEWLAAQLTTPAPRPRGSPSNHRQQRSAAADPAEPS